MRGEEIDMCATNKLKGSSFINDEPKKIDSKCILYSKKRLRKMSCQWMAKFFVKWQGDNKIFHIIEHKDLNKFDLM